MAKRSKPTAASNRTASRPLFSSLDTPVIYCDDNSEKLKELPASFVDLVYIDPPFNSNRNYEIFWPEDNQTRAFEDRHASTEAYIQFMRPRCVELRRVLKSTGSFYYHCDWHASHYIKVMLDQIFGSNSFRNEIIWKRASTIKGNAGQGSKLWGPNTDSILFYTVSENYTFHPEFKDYSEDYIKKFYKYVEPDTGRRYRLISMIGPGGAAKGNPQYEVMGVTRYWRYSPFRMQELIDQGMVVQTKPGTVPVRKQYLDEGSGVAIQTLWDDIEAIGSSSKERLGYPTQKPVDLLDRIIRASSNLGDVVLDAFCGCGTALVAAQDLRRLWIGIDISPTACNVMADRLERECGLVAGKDFHVVDERKDEDFLRRIPHFEFENWAVLAIGGIPNATKVNDWGIDGRIYPASHMPGRTKADEGKFNFMDHWYPVQAKQIDHVGRQEIDLFSAAMERAGRTKGYFVSFGFSGPAITETRRLREHVGRNIVPITVKEILDKEDQLAMKLP